MKTGLIFIAGPYTKGDVAVNVKNAIDAAETLAQHGYYSFIPHLSHFWHMAHPRPYEFWCAQDIEVLKRCDALVRIPGDSEGADNEVRIAELHGIPVYYGVRALIDNG